jgi:hypothetical protein
MGSSWNSQDWLGAAANTQGNELGFPTLRMKAMKI